MNVNHRLLQLEKELREAHAAEATLRQQRAHMIHAVAHSPVKVKKNPHKNKNATAEVETRTKHDKTTSGRGGNVGGGGGSRNGANGAKGKTTTTTTAARKTRKNNATKEQQSIPAFHPQAHSPTDSHRAVDTAIAKSVVAMLNSNKSNDGNHPDHHHASLAPPARPSTMTTTTTPHLLHRNSPSPVFFTSKRRHMHCEMDEPGITVPFAKKRNEGFFARLFSCFNGGGGSCGDRSSVLYSSPPSAASTMHGRPSSGHQQQHQQGQQRSRKMSRSSSAEMTPVQLTLKSEMAPLRQSLASLKPALLLESQPHPAHPHSTSTATNSDATTTGTPKRPNLDILKNSKWLQHHVSDNEVSNGTSTGGGGGNGGNGGGNNNETSRDNDDSISQTSSIESLQAELSEIGSPEVADVVYHRTPVAGVDGRPVQKIITPLRKGQSPVPYRPFPAQMQMQMEMPMQSSQPAMNIDMSALATLLHALSMSGGVPLPPAHPININNTTNAQPGPSSTGHGVKQTQFKLSSLLHNAQQQPAEAEHHQYPHHRAQAQPQDGVVPSPLAQPATKNQQQQPPAVRMTKAAAARNQATQRLLELRRQRERAHLERFVRTTNNGRPAAIKRKEAFNVDSTSHQHHHHHLGGGGVMNEHETALGCNEDIPLPKRPRSASKKNHNATATTTATMMMPTGRDADVGFQIPPAPTHHTAPIAPLHLPSFGDAQSGGDDSIGAVPARSPGFYQMLERLAAGMSVDMAKVEAEKKVSTPVALGSPLSGTCTVVGGGSGRGSGEEQRGSGVDFDAQTNTLFTKYAGVAGAREPSPLVNIAAQKLVSMTDVVSRSSGSASGSGSGSTTGDEDTKHGEGGGNTTTVVSSAESSIKVDASSNTLLGNLLDMERSLTIDDLHALKMAIRKEYGAI